MATGRAIRIGTSGYVYPHWRGVLYPPGLPQARWLERYAEVFDTVEINASFYRLPPPERFAAWAARVPRGFLFAVKAPRIVTHRKRLRGAEPWVERFLDAVAPLGRRLGALLWQLPPTFRADPERLEAFLAALPRPRGVRHAFELRHPSWWETDVLERLRRHRAALVVAHSASRPEISTPRAVATCDLAYVRLHDGAGGDGAYGEEELRAWAARVRALAREARVLVYFNNDWRGHAVRNALRLRELLEATPNSVEPGEPRAAVEARLSGQRRRAGERPRDRRP